MISVCLLLQEIAKVLYRLLNCNVKEFFYKLNVHAGEYPFIFFLCGNSMLHSICYWLYMYMV